MNALQSQYEQQQLQERNQRTAPAVTFAKTSNSNGYKDNVMEITEDLLVLVVIPHSTIFV